MTQLELTALAREAGAPHLVAEVAHSELCTQLAYHLTQLQRMLGASEAECGASVKSISLLRALAELALEQRRLDPDSERAKLERWLEVERRKFLMATGADMLVGFAERIATTTRRRPGYRRAAAIAVREITRESLVAFRARLLPGVQRQLAAMPNHLVEDLLRSIGHVSEPVPLNAVARTPVLMRAFVTQVDVAPRGIGREDLVDAVELGTKRATALVLHDYDDIRATLEAHFLELTDSWLETAKAAAAFAKRARESSDEYAARAKVARWFLALAKLSASCQ